MNAFDDIAARVERRVQELILPALLNSLADVHANRGHRDGCQCDYCKMKRRATSDIGYIKPHLINKGFRRSAIYSGADQVYDIGNGLQYIAGKDGVDTITPIETHVEKFDYYGSTATEFVAWQKRVQELTDEWAEVSVQYNPYADVVVTCKGPRRMVNPCKEITATERNSDETYFLVKSVRERLADDWRKKLAAEKAR